jgi:hypothetical protein
MIPRTAAYSGQQCLDKQSGAPLGSNRPLDEGLDPKTKGYLEGFVVEVGRALEAGEVLYTTRLYDPGELRRFERAAEKLKKELWGKR